MVSNKQQECIDVLQTLQSQMHNAACYLRDIGMQHKEAELRGAANIVGDWICGIWDDAKQPDDKAVTPPAE